MYIYAYPGFARYAFREASDPILDGWHYATTHYPSKTAAITLGAADALYLWQCYLSNNKLGLTFAAAGIYSTLVVALFGDPKIPAGQESTFIDPQETRSVWKRLANPVKYPWEHLAATRSLALPFMIAGALDVAGLGGGKMRPGELLCALLCMLGYGTKMLVAEAKKGSVPIPETRKRLHKMFYKARAYVRENPNPTASKLFLASDVPYGIEAFVLAEYVKLGAGLVYVLPNIMTLFTSKRAKSRSPKS